MKILMLTDIQINTLKKCVEKFIEVLEQEHHTEEGNPVLESYERLLHELNSPKEELDDALLGEYMRGFENAWNKFKKQKRKVV